MKSKFIFFFLFHSFIAFVSNANNRFDSLPGKTGRITMILSGIKTEQANKNIAENAVSVAQNNSDTQKPALEEKRDEKYTEANALYKKYNNIYPEGSAQLANAQMEVNAANAAGDGYQGQIDDLENKVKEAKQELDRADAALKDWQQQLQAIGNVSGASWDCFFDNKCNDEAVAPERGKGTVIVPNTGAPGIFTPLSEEYKNRHNPDNGNVPVPSTVPAQKGVIEQATDKVKSYFRDIIKKSKEIKVRITTAVAAVRG